MEETTKLKQVENEYKSKRICSCNLCTPTPECVQARGNYNKLVQQNKSLQSEIKLLKLKISEVA